jgi:hypothetical protein
MCLIDWKDSYTMTRSPSFIVLLAAGTEASGAAAVAASATAPADMHGSTMGLHSRPSTGLFDFKWVGECFWGVEGDGEAYLLLWCAAAAVGLLLLLKKPLDELLSTLLRFGYTKRYFRLSTETCAAPGTVCCAGG